MTHMCPPSSLHSLVRTRCWRTCFRRPSRRNSDPCMKTGHTRGTPGRSRRGRWPASTLYTRPASRRSWSIPSLPLTPCASRSPAGKSRRRTWRPVQRSPTARTRPCCTRCTHCRASARTPHTFLRCPSRSFPETRHYSHTLLSASLPGAVAFIARAIRNTRYNRGRGSWRRPRTRPHLSRCSPRGSACWRSCRRRRRRLHRSTPEET